MRDPFSGTTVSRRRTLKILGGGALAGVIGGVGLPAPFDPPDVAHETADSGEMEPLEESATPYAIWQYRPESSDSLTPTLPINVVFPLEAAAIEEVIEAFEAHGWVPRPAEYPRYAWNRATEQYERPTWSGAETYYGLVGRLHVRCWELDGTASIQAHVDTPPTPSHSIRSHAEARAAVERLFEAAGWTIDDDPYFLGNDRGDHDGYATVIRQ